MNSDLTKIHAYVINLEHSTERWNLIKSNLQSLNIPYTRIEGIPGEKLPNKVKGYNRLRYNIVHGKKTNKQEIGCYFSHIKALRSFLETNNEFALILEDDITLPEKITNLIESALHHRKHWDMLRLSAHKEGCPQSIASLPHGHILAYNIRPLKNTGAYLINRYAARCICEKMLPMYLPYDVALDCEWRYGFKTAYIHPLPVLINYELPSQIPPARKLRFFRTTTFHFSHGMRQLQRKQYRTKWLQEAQASPLSSH